MVVVAAPLWPRLALTLTGRSALHVPGQAWRVRPPRGLPACIVEGWCTASARAYGATAGAWRSHSLHHGGVMAGVDGRRVRMHVRWYARRAWQACAYARMRRAWQAHCAQPGVARGFICLVLPQA